MFLLEGILVPQNVNEIDKFETGAEFVLVVEKDSMFQKLLDEKIVDKLNQSFVMITVSIIHYNVVILHVALNYRAKAFLTSTHDIYSTSCLENCLYQFTY